MKINNRVACITLDLESDHAGRCQVRYDGWKEKYIRELFACLKQHRVPLTAFVVANALMKNQHTINYMLRRGTEFYLHSYSHDRKNPDSAEEIHNGIREFQNYFKKHPRGYRAPEGRISDNGYRILHQSGFRFDSSVFPSFWPHPKYLFSKRTIHKGPYGVTEIPVTTVTPARIIFSLSWVQLIGWKIYRLLLDIFPLSGAVLFDFHLHDLYNLPAAESMSPFWRFIYRKRQTNGLHVLNQILSYLQKHGYVFVPISSLISEGNV